MPHFTDIALTLEKNIARAVCLLHIPDITLEFEKNIARAVYLPHFADITLDFEKNIARTFSFQHFMDIALNFEKKHERDLAGPGVYLTASDLEATSALGRMKSNQMRVYLSSRYR